MADDVLLLGLSVEWSCRGSASKRFTDRLCTLGQTLRAHTDQYASAATSSHHAASSLNSCAYFLRCSRMVLMEIQLGI